MRAILAASALALAYGCHPAVAQPQGPGGPSITIQAPCAPAEFAMARLKGEGFVRAAKGSDTDGDPFALYRRPDGGWRAISLVTVNGAVFACAVLGGDGMIIDADGKGA